MVYEMAVQRPHTFDVRNPDRWPEWVEQWERYRNEILCDEPDEVHLISLLHAIGGDARDIVKSLKLSNDQRSQYHHVREALDKYFPKKYVIRERCKFYTRKQEDSETAEDYIITIKKIAAKCEFVDISSQIRDRLISGVIDNTLRNDMLMTALELTEEVVIRMVLTNEKKKKAKKRSSSTSLPETSKVHESPCHFEISKRPRYTLSRFMYNTSSEKKSGGSDTPVSPPPSLVFPAHQPETSTSIQEEETFPDNLSESLMEAIRKIKEIAAKVDNKNAFFKRDDVNKLLKQIVIESETMEERAQKQIYSTLEEHLQCEPATLMRRVDLFRLDRKVTKEKTQLEQAVALVMKRFEEKTRSHGTNSLAHGAQEGTPTRRFKWNKKIRHLLREMVRHKIKWIKLSSKTLQPEKLKQFFENEVKLLWPERWIQTRELWKQTASVHNLSRPDSSVKLLRSALSSLKYNTSSEEQSGGSDTPVSPPPSPPPSPVFPTHQPETSTSIQEEETLPDNLSESLMEAIRKIKEIAAKVDNKNAFFKRDDVNELWQHSIECSQSQRLDLPPGGLSQVVETPLDLYIITKGGF
ncbi:hypothetical protein LSAT2_027057 [Lamellibrachia satsuma]|nr:hypothetical protein LSAT2_027057 [Lamellibrachia satsuma]